METDDLGIELTGLFITLDGLWCITKTGEEELEVGQIVNRGTRRFGRTYQVSKLVEDRSYSAVLREVMVWDGWDRRTV